jgi:hypothetical protein
MDNGLAERRDFRKFRGGLQRQTTAGSATSPHRFSRPDISSLVFFRHLNQKGKQRAKSDTGNRDGKTATGKAPARKWDQKREDVL